MSSGSVQVGASQLEQERHGPVAVLGPRACFPLTLATSGATPTVQLTLRWTLRLRNLRVQSGLTHTLPGWSFVHAACFLGLYFWRTDVTTLLENLLLKVRWPDHSTVPRSLLEDRILGPTLDQPNKSLHFNQVSG